jgi:hypothetical protein
MYAYIYTHTHTHTHTHTVLSLRRVLRASSTVPSARTASRPSTEPLREPYRINRRPPALVAMLP